MTYPTARKNRSHNMNHFFNAFVQPQPVKRAQTAKGANAAVNIAETEDNFRVELAAPGWAKADFNIELEKEVLTIHAKKEVVKAKEGEKFLRREFVVNELKRTFNLPDTIDTTAIGAEYMNGILTLTLPKKEEAKPQAPRKVDIA
jgi:HSP20 family protein